MVRRFNGKCRLTVTLCVMVFGLGGVAHAEEPQSEPSDLRADVDRLKGYVDPKADHWPTEVFHQYAKKQLASFGAYLDPAARDSAFDLGPWFAPSAEIEPLRSAPQRETIGQYTIAHDERRGGAAQGMLTPPSAFLRLIAPFDGASFDILGVPRITFKIIAVHSQDQRTFATDVLVQLFGPSGSGWLQYNATWSVVWTKTGDSQWLIQRIDVVKSNEVAVPSLRFRDSTRSVIKDGSVWSPHLAYGSDYWFGRIDAIGERNHMGHQGIAIGDANGDGDEDVYVAMGEGIPNKLLIRQKDGTVRDAAQEAGVGWLDSTKGVLFADLDNDGDQDLLCAIASSIVVCANNGDGTFTPARAFKAGTPAAFYSLAAADYDNDGDLDIYATRYVKARYGISVPMPFHDANNGPRNHLMRNDGKRGFTDVTREVGLDVNNSRFSLSAGWRDFDNDGDLDLYVSNDFGRNNLYRNDNGKFVDIAAAAGAEDQAAGMGVSWSDYDLDGDDDLLISNMYSSAGRRIAYQNEFLSEQDSADRGGVQRHSLGNTLLANQGDGTFKDVSEAAGIRLGRWAWGAQFVDLNNDGYDDMIVPNGFLTSDRMDDL
ncbi:MAG: VCBS repeat-containing protein [Planctomycetes bacterium]|nr:VCBS repeat-containing protein [Planctomycetota bacterium]